MTTGPEYEKVEQPFIDQLTHPSMGWEYIAGDVDDPTVTGREDFREVLLLDDLRKAIIRINKNDQGKPWLDEARVTTAVSALQRLGQSKLMEANQAATRLLLMGISVEGLPDWDGGRTQTVHFIDWENPDRNTFRAINQFRVDEPGGQAKKYILPDIVLFINGIPVAVVECKSPYLSAPMEEAIDQLRRYSNQRKRFEENEGNEKLFHYNQLMIGTHFDEARVGTIGAQAEHYMEWKDTIPTPMADVAAILGKNNISSQEKMIAGMLKPKHLLDIIRHFILYKTETGTTIKVVARYQQFRAVQFAIRRLLTGKTKTLDGEHDRRGGIIWHTQGSGKSISMVFLVRKMRSVPELRKFKVVLVTDRRNLQKQLADTAELTGETVEVAKKTARMKEMLAKSGPGLVFAMIQKYREPDPLYDDDEMASEDEGIPDQQVETFPVLNEDESILVLVDEAHRSHGSALHANLLAALPNCARIGFTGTPIIMGKKKQTHKIFGEFIDRYTIRQSEEDGSTVPILYEGRTSEGAVADGRDLDEVFEDMFHDRTPEELEKIKQKYAAKGQVMEAPKLIQAKARDMLRHYVENILPNGFKAQVVAVSRLAAIRYHEAFKEAQAELVERLDDLEPKLIGLDSEEIEKLPSRTQFMARAHRFLDTIRKMEFAPVISGGNNDDPAWREWTERAKAENRIEQFKKPYPSEEMKDPEKTSHLGMLIVKSMLLTGFDAPVEQVMYLDRHIKEAELLQAIARVNRTHGPKKARGFVVDYYGVARHLKEALDAYSPEDIEGALQSLNDEIPKLRDQHLRVLKLFQDRNIKNIADEEACIQVLEDEKLRAEFQVKLKHFLSTLDLVLPRPEGLPFVRDAKTLANIQIRTRNRYRGGENPIGKEVGEKVRKLIDDHIISLGVDPKIPPMSIMDADFGNHIEKGTSNRAKASEMEHALRHHIRLHIDQDPEHYQKLSERLDQILSELKAQWAELVKVLSKFVAEVQAGRQQDDTGLDPETQAPFLGVIRKEKGDVSPEELNALAQITIELVEHIQQEIRIVGFWRKAQAQEALRNWIVQFLDDHDVLEYDRLPEVADRLVELAKANQYRLGK